MKQIGIGLALLVGVGGTLSAQADGPALGNNRITQAQITSGTMTMQQLRRAGLMVFSTPFNKQDGMGDGPVNHSDPKSPGGRPTINGTWMRVNGIDSQTCLECHFARTTNTIPMTFAVGGTGGIAATAMPGIQSMDLEDLDNNELADIDGRTINPPFVFGAGGVELVGNEMTVELQALKAQAQAFPGSVVQLVAKGIDFGSISYDMVLGFDTTNVVGIEDDLVVRPFGRKGDNSSVRKFDTGALQFHHGMQPQEVVGNGVDADGDGVADEILVGELSALHIFSVNLERPRSLGKTGSPIADQLFASTGCAACHIPLMQTDSKILDLCYPEVETDPTANIYLSVDLTANAEFRSNQLGGVRVDMFSDLKRHDMGPSLAETTGGALDAFFITPRLWGVADSAPYMHDGRALTLRDAILAHDGEGLAAAQAFAALNGSSQKTILSLLGRLRVPDRPSHDISAPVRVK